MIDLDAYRSGLDRMSQVRPGPGWASYRAGLAAARDLLDMMRAEALPDPATPAMPPMNGTTTTQAMREAAFPRSGSLRRRIIDHLRIQPTTDDGLEVALARSHQSVSAARFQLTADGWLEPAKFEDGAPMTARTRSGNQATLWRLTPAALRRTAAPDYRPGGIER